MSHRTVTRSGSAPTVVALAREIARGEISVESIARACLERIEVDEPRVRAWAHLDPALVLARARDLDHVPATERSALQIVGLPTQDARTLASAAWVEAALGEREVSAL